MLVWAYLQWWYGSGWRDAIRRIWGRSRRIYLDFSIPILLRTLFAPWRRIISPSSGGLDQRLRAVIDNVLSRVIGFVVRFITLVIASVLIGANILLSATAAILWPALPLISVGFIIWGLTK